MADHAQGPAELGAEMDYAEHEKTYNLFLAGAKYGTLSIIALIIAMAAFFFTSFGFFSSLILFIIINAVGGYILR